MPSNTVLAIEIGGTKLQMGIAVPGQPVTTLARARVDAAAGAPGILAWVERETPILLAEHKFGAIGVGFGGPIETDTGTILVSHQIHGWEGFALKTWLEEKFGLPAVVANDANAAGWAEYCLGAGRGTRNFVYNNIGSGIGGALVVNGELYDGQGRGACEIGHTYVPDWTSNTPGAYDKLEHLCSGWAIERRLRSAPTPALGTALHDLSGGDPKTLSGPMLAQAAEKGDPAALQEIHYIAEAIAIALSNVVTLLHPERIALGGGVSLMGDILLDPIRQYMDQRAFGPYRARYTLVQCELGENVVLDGAALLARQLL